MNWKLILQNLSRPRKNPKEVKVILDPGHGEYDWGLNTVVRGKKTPNKGYKGIMEKDINLEIANRVGWLCSRHSVGYLMTRYGDRFISLKKRCQIANKTNSKLFISFHCNYAHNIKVRGVETYYYQGSSSGRPLAKEMQKLLLDLKYTKNRKAKSDRFYVLRNTKMPAILPEFGFLSNKEDATYLNNENNQMKIAVQIWELIKQIVL